MKKFIFLVGAMMVFALLVAPVQAQEGESPITNIIVQSGATIYYGTQAEPVSEPAEELLGWSTKDEIWLNNDSGVIYFDTDKGSGIRVNSGTMQCKNSGGDWGACAGTTPGDNGWLADGINNAMYPGTNATGGIYPLIVGVTATSSPATANTELYVGGGGGAVFTENVWITGSSTTEGGARFNDGSADVNFLVETNGDAVAFWVDGGLDAIGMGVVDPNAKLEILKTTAQLQLSYDGSNEAIFTTGSGGDLTIAPSGGDLNITGTSTPSLGLVVGTDMLVVNAVTDAVGINVADPDSGLEILHTTAPLKLSYDGSNACTFVVSSGGDGTYNCSGGDISYTNENLDTSGTLAAGNTTITGNLIVDTDTLFVNGSTDRAGAGTSTPWAIFSVNADGSDSAFVVGSSTATVIEVKATGVVHGNDNGTSYVDFLWEGDAVTDLFFIDASADVIGIGTSTPSGTYEIDIDGDVRIGETGNASAFIINAGTGAITTNGDGAATADITFAGDADTALFFVDASSDRVGVGTSTPWATFSIDAVGTDSAFSIGSSTATILEVKSTGVVHGNDNGTSYVDFIWEGDSVTNAFVLDASADGVGIASSTPAFTAQLAIGEGGTASSTISAGRFCMYAEQEDGTGVYLILGASQANNQPFATSTTSCF